MTAKHNLSLFDVLCLWTNAIVGSGIFMFPGKLAALLPKLAEFCVQQADADGSD